MRCSICLSREVRGESLPGDRLVDFKGLLPRLWIRVVQRYEYAPCLCNRVAARVLSDSVFVGKSMRVPFVHGHGACPVQVRCSLDVSLMCCRSLFLLSFAPLLLEVSTASGGGGHRHAREQRRLGGSAPGDLTTRLSSLPRAQKRSSSASIAAAPPRAQPPRRLHRRAGPSDRR